MTRLAIFTLVALACSTGMGPASADEIKGKVKSIDLEKGTLVVTVGEVDRTFAVPAGARVFGAVGKKAKPREVEGGLKGVKEGAEVTLTTEVKDGKELASTVKVEKLAKADAKAKVKKAAKVKKVKAKAGN